MLHTTGAISIFSMHLSPPHPTSCPYTPCFWTPDTAFPTVFLSFSSLHTLFPHSVPRLARCALRISCYTPYVTPSISCSLRSVPIIFVHILYTSNVPYALFFLVFHAIAPHFAVTLHTSYYILISIQDSPLHLSSPSFSSLLSTLTLLTLLHIVYF